MYDDHLRHRLEAAETDFLSALSSGENDLASYHSTWSCLLDDVSVASSHGNLRLDTIEAAHTVASKVATIADCFLTIECKYQDLTHKLHGDWDSILNSFGNISIAQQTTTSPSPRLKSHQAIPLGSDSDSSLPPFIAPAYDWLLQNLHNPYPSSDFKTSIARATGSSPSSVNAWFVNARRRMGWTAICRDRFLNCRADAVDAAHRALVKEDPQRGLPAELIHTFMVMKVAAEGLYSSTFTKSSLAGDLDAVVKDMTEEDKKMIEAEKCREAEETKLAKQREKEMRRKQRALEKEMQKNLAAQDAYPSPNGSRTSSPVPTLDESYTDEEDALPPVVAGRKRRSSSVELVDCAPLSLTTRPMKRLRSSASVDSSLAPEACLPSPPSSADSTGESSDYDSPTFTSYTSPTTPPTDNHAITTVSRKRRLSHTDANSLPKRPRGSTAGPRLHAVSDPLPRSTVESEYSIDEWFNTNFDALFALPPPVDSVEPDHSAPWEVELFSDYCIPQDLHRTSKSPSPHTPEYQTSATTLPTDLAELDSLLQSFGGNALVASSQASDESSAPFVASYADPLSLDVSLPSDLAIDWTTLLNNTESLTPTGDTKFPQSYPSSESQPLPEIDLSILQLPQFLPASNTQAALSPDFASKQAKLLQYQVMQEAVKKMEMELQSEGLAV